jgi:hypothetical protein
VREREREREKKGKNVGVADRGMYTQTGRSGRGRGMGWVAGLLSLELTFWLPLPAVLCYYSALNFSQPTTVP